MDAYAKKHLEDWLTRNTRGNERFVVRAKILKTIKERPELIDPEKIEENKSWAEIRDMSENPKRRKSRRNSRRRSKACKRVLFKYRMSRRHRLMAGGEAPKRSASIWKWGLPLLAVGAALFIFGKKA